MKLLRTWLIAMLATLAVVAAGCAGAGVEGADAPSSETGPSVFSPSSGLAPEGSGDASVEAADQEADEGQVADAPADADADEADSAISCDFDQKVEAEVGEPYTQDLSASGGSGQFRFEAEALPQGLLLSRSGAISGTPEIAGGDAAVITVIDLESGEDRHCSIDFTIREQIEVSASLLREASRTIWVLTISGTSAGSLYSWSFSQTQHLCGSTSSAVAQGSSCPDLPLHGKTVYLWRNEGKEVGLEVTATAASAFAAPASALISFEPELPTPAMGGQPVAANPVGALEVESITVKTMTGVFEHPGTDCDITITFCTDAAMSDCVEAQYLDNEDLDDFEGGNTDTFEFPHPPSGMTSEHRYFKIRQKDANCGDHPGWHLRGVKVKVEYDDGSSYRYYNPCIAKWMNKNDTITFGPEDTAVCAKITTGDVSKAGTNDYINLQVTTRSNVDLDDLSFGSDGLSTGAPHFDPQWAEDHDLSHHLPLVIEWADYDDCERGDVDWYGDYIFDSNPFSDDPKARVKKGSDGENGGWYLSSYDVYIFQPAKLSEPGTIFHEDCSFDGWIEEENTLITPECELHPDDEDEIDSSVGKN